MRWLQSWWPIKAAADRRCGGQRTVKMLSPDSFLRRIPHALEIKSRVILEAAGWAIDSILISLSDLEAVVWKMPESEGSIELEHRVFVNCWSIIDQCHMLRSLLQRLEKTEHIDIATFVARTERFTFLRNSMDHLSTKLDNLVNAKGDRAPLFGAFTWVKVKPSDFKDGYLTGYTIWSVSSGASAIQAGWQMQQPAQSAQLPQGVSCFSFEAFDFKISFEELNENIASLLAHFDEVVGPRIDQNIREAARSLGLDPEETLKPRGRAALKLGMVIERR